jgi:hypothetical protein
MDGKGNDENVEPADSAPGPASDAEEWPSIEPIGELGPPRPPPAPRLPLPPEPPSGWFTPDLVERVIAWARARYFERDPSFRTLFVPFAVLALILFSRWPGTNYIFDEQEALLANPYVNATQGLRYIDAIHRDFWGLLPDRSIGSYRPIPDLLWRAVWQLSSKPDGLFRQPFLHHIYNVVFHAVNATIMSLIVFAWTKRRGQAVVAGLVFGSCAVLTEAVSGIVGIADVLGGMGALLAIAALSLPGWAMPFAVFTAVSFGLFCKESALVCVPLVPFAALCVAPLTHPERPARFLRAALAFVGAAAAFYLYVELRKRWFPSPLPGDLVDDPAEDAPWVTRFAHDFLVWFHQAPLPKDPLNNPLVNADKPHRIAGALRVYFRGLGQLVYPTPLSGDYSFPQEPIPDDLVFPESVAGAALTALPPLGSLVLWLVALWRERGGRRAAGLPLPDRFRYARRIAGLLLTLVASSIVALDLLVFRPRGQILAYRNLPLWLASIPVALLGLGLLAEGLPALPRPDPRPLRYSGLILLGVGMTWVVVSYFPHSNIPIVLPTVRAERFWYFPAIGSTLVLSVVFAWIHEAVMRRGPDAPAREGRQIVGLLLVFLVSVLAVVDAWVLHPRSIPLAYHGFPFWVAAIPCAILGLALFAGGLPGRVLGVFAPALFAGFVFFSGVQAYRHAMDYRSDVDFWRATKDAVPRSAKAHLNYSVMKGARGDLTTRLEESRIAMTLAPKWPMAHIYTGDTLCRMHRAKEAWQYYQEGFDIGPNDLSLIALALQCLYDEKELLAHEDELRTIAAAHEGSWIAYLATDTLGNHEKNKGVDPKYRPRGYNEGPKE